MPRRAPPLPGERAIKRFRCQFVFVVAAPLLLGGCGLPVGIQIASLFADGVSFLATDKTLTDHGISLVADKDCALWRGLKGEDVCRAVAPDEILVAEAVPPQFDTVFAAEAPAGEIPVADAAEPVTAVTEPAVEVTELASLETAAGPVDAVPEETKNNPAPQPVVLEETSPVEAAPAVAAALDETVVAVAEKPAIAESEGGTFLVIASYYRSGDAERFARKQDRLETKVLSGTARGRKVFRVAVGPFAGPERKSAKADLVRAGFGDVWALKLRQPEVVVQVAAID